MKTRLIFVRHGYSVSNEGKFFAGHTDVDLTERGYKQAALTAEYLRNEKIDAVYSSDLKRAYNTALPIAKMHSLTVIKDERLREIYAGEWEGLSFEELRKSYGEDYSVWLDDIGRSRCTGGESTIELLDRIFARTEDIARENEGKTVLIATHATPIRVLCTLAAGEGMAKMAEIPFVMNASVTRFDYENGILTAVSVDENEHLGEYGSRPLKC